MSCEECKELEGIIATQQKEYMDLQNYLDWLDADLKEVTSRLEASYRMEAQMAAAHCRKIIEILKHCPGRRIVIK